MTHYLKQRITTGAAGVLVILAYLLPLIIAQENAYILIHDNLDCHPIQFANIYKNIPIIFHDSQFPQIVNNNLRPSTGIDLNFALIPYHLLSPYRAYLFIQITSRLIAYFGLFLLLIKLMNKPRGDKLIICSGVAALFAILPHYPPLAYTIPLLPWLSWAFLSIGKNQSRWFHWTVLVVAPLFSNFFVAPVFLIALIGIGWLYAGLKKRKWRLPLLGALVLCGTVYLISEHHLLLSLFNKTGYESLRVERIMNAGWVSLTGVIKESATNFIVGQYHVFSLHEFIIIISTISIIMSMRRKIVCYEFKILIGLIILCGLISLWVGLYYWRPLAHWRTTYWGPLNMIGWDRVHWLHPMLWYLALTYALILILDWPRKGKYLAYCFLIMQGVYEFSCSDFWNERRTNHITFKQFFAEQQFHDIMDFIDLPPENYRVASLGIHPSISIFNGFYALDGYTTDYDIAHKRSFRKIIAPELIKNPTLNNYYETYGLRCYLFSSELGKYPLYTKWKNRSIERLELNLDEFVSMKGRYILSAVKINQAADCGLRLVRVFDSPDSAWIIYLYEPDFLTENLPNMSPPPFNNLIPSEEH